MRGPLLIIGLVVGCCCHTAAAEPPLHAKIDQLIAATANGPLASQADDAEFLRRATLDLAGRVPTVAETTAFLAESGSQKRIQLIDRLFAAPDYGRRMQEFLEVLVLERRTETTIKSADWTGYLRESFQQNQPWDSLVGKLLFVGKEDTQHQPAMKFILATGRKGNAHQTTQDIARIFLGRDIMCAQCHNHPSIDAYTQQDYFGLFSYVQEQSAKSTSEFESVFEPGKKKTGPRLPGGQEVKIPKFEKGQEAEAEKFRPRRLLARDLPTSTNRSFLRTSVNRFWALLMGRGLVEPLDQDHSENPPSHPMLFTLLQEDFSAHKFDIRYLLREIMLSQAYQRSSRLPEGITAKQLPVDRYRTAIPRPLSPEQLAWSLMVATGNRQRMLKATAPENSPFSAYNYINGKVDRLPATLSETMELFAWMIGNPPGESPDAFNPAMGHALFLMNEKLVLDWLQPREGSLVGRLQKINDRPKAVTHLYLSVLARRPSAEESQDAVTYLESHKADRTQALGDLAWSLLASAEFRFNH